MDISNITGPPVGGTDFFDREWELDKLTRAIKAGNHVLLTAPRRVGKSSLLLRAVEWARTAGWTAIHIDVQDCDTEAALLEKLIRGSKDAGIKLPLLDELVKKARALKRFLAGTKLGAEGIEIEIGEDGPPDWREGGLLFQKILKEVSAGEKRVLVGVDELPIFLAKLGKAPEGHDRVDLVLRWLRSLRHASLGGVSWVLCGSVGLDTFVERHGLAGTINDLQLQRLGPFPEETAVEFLMALGGSSHNPLSLSNTLAEHMVQRVGWPLPYYLQLMFHALRELPPHARSGDYPSPEDVDAAYRELLSPHSSNYFAHWDARLGDQLDPAQVAAARFLLKQICTSSQGVGRDRLLQMLLARHPQADPEVVERELGQVLDILERDGYLMRSGSTWAFRSFLLRDYWKQRFA